LNDDSALAYGSARAMEKVVTATTTIQLKHGKVRVCSEGPENGPVVLWIHGATYPLEVFSLLTPAFIEQGYRCIRYDLYGRANSQWDSCPLTTGVLAEQALEVLEYFEIESKVHVITLSNSDLIANVFARRYPSKVETVSWIAPSGTDRRTMNAFFRTANLIPGMDSFMSLFMKPYLIQRMGSHRKHLAPEPAKLAGPIYDIAVKSLKENPQATKAATNYFLNLPTKEAVEVDLVGLDAAHIPVMMILFGEEKDANENDLNLFRHHIRPTEVYVEGADHMGLLEKPEAILPHLLQFTVN